MKTETETKLKWKLKLKTENWKLKLKLNLKLKLKLKTETATESETDTENWNWNWSWSWSSEAEPVLPILSVLVFVLPSLGCWCTKQDAQAKTLNGVGVVAGVVCRHDGAEEKARSGVTEDDES